MPLSRDEPHQPRRAWGIAALLFLFMAVNFMDKIAVGLLAVPMMRELQLTPAQFGLVGSSFFWLFAVAGVAGGFLADRRPTTGLLLGMALIWTVCQLPLALSGGLAALVTARVLLGIGEGPAFPVATHACYKWFPDTRRNMPVALLSIGSAVGLLLAGILVPLVAAHWGWRVNFMLLAALTALWSLAWLAIGREGPIPVGPAAGDNTVDNDRASASASGSTAALQAASGAAAPARLPYRRLLANPTVLGCMLMRFVAYWGLALALTWLPAYLERGLGFSSIGAGRVYALIVLITIPLTLLLPWISQRLLARGVSSRHGRGSLSALALAAGGLLFVGLLLDQMPVALRVASIAIASGLAPAVYTLGPAMLAEVVPGAQRGALLAIDNSFGSLAGVLAPVVTGVLIQNSEGNSGFQLAFALSGIFMIAGGIGGALLARPERSARTLAAAAATAAV